MWFGCDSQAGTAETDYLNAVSMGSDGSSVLAGKSVASPRMVAYPRDVGLIFKYHTALVVVGREASNDSKPHRKTGSINKCWGVYPWTGLSFGQWNGTNADTSDASLRPAATKLDADGNILWKWQVSESGGPTPGMP